MTAEIMRARAADLAENLLFPASLDVDRADRVPAGHLDALAGAGLYGLDDDLPALAAVLRELASGCLATAFVWLQHHGCVRAAAHSDEPGVARRWLAPLTSGQIRGGIALAGVRSAADPLRVRAVPGGYVLDGRVPWVTGWEMVDVLHVAARAGDDRVHFLFVDARSGPTLEVELLDLVAARASRTGDARFTGHFVPGERLTAVQPYAQWAAADAAGSTLNGFLALGVAQRCIVLGEAGADAGTGALEDGGLAGALRACHERLLCADSASTAGARAAASKLALTAAARLAVRTGARAVLPGDHAQMLLREAMFTLVFGSRPGIRDALLDIL